MTGNGISRTVGSFSMPLMPEVGEGASSPSDVERDETVNPTTLYRSPAIRCGVRAAQSSSSALPSTSSPDPQPFFPPPLPSPIRGGAGMEGKEDGNGQCGKTAV